LDDVRHQSFLRTRHGGAATATRTVPRRRRPHDSPAALPYRTPAGGGDKPSYQAWARCATAIPRIGRQLRPREVSRDCPSAAGPTLPAAGHGTLPEVPPIRGTVPDPPTGPPTGRMPGNGQRKQRNSLDRYAPRSRSWATCDRRTSGTPRSPATTTRRAPAC